MTHEHVTYHHPGIDSRYHNPNKRPNGRNCVWCQRPKGGGEPPGRCRRCLDERAAQQREAAHQDD